MDSMQASLEGEMKAKQEAIRQVFLPSLLFSSLFPLFFIEFARKRKTFLASLKELTPWGSCQASGLADWLVWSPQLWLSCQCFSLYYYKRLRLGFTGLRKSWSRISTSWKWPWIMPTKLMPKLSRPSNAWPPTCWKLTRLWRRRLVLELTLRISVALPIEKVSVVVSSEGRNQFRLWLFIDNEMGAFEVAKKKRPQLPGTDIFFWL